MRRQTRLFIGGQEVDLSDDGLILFNHTLEDLSNPTIVKNSYTQRVTLKGTPANNELFGHIWRLDREQGYGSSVGMDFDPSRKTGFQLFDGTGRLLESGYVKLDNILRHGVDIQYSVTLYGGLGSFLYGLSFDSEGNQRSLANLDYLATGDPDRELDFTINAEAVQSAWGRVLSDPVAVQTVWDVINFAPCYNGIPDKFAASKGIIKPTEVGLPAAHPEDASYSTLSGWALLEMVRDMTEWEAKDLRSYLQRPVVSVRAVLGAIARQAAANGVTFDWSVLDGSDYDGMWVTLPLLPSLEAYKNVSTSIALTIDPLVSTPTGYYAPVSVGTALPVGTRMDVSMNVALSVSVSGASAGTLNFAKTEYSGGIGTTERYDFSGLFAQLVAYDSEGRVLGGSDIICVGASQDYGQLERDGKVRAEATGYIPQVERDYTYLDASLVGGSGSYVLSQDLNLTVTCYNAASFRLFVTPYHFRKTIHYGSIYRKTWRSSALGSSAMTVYSGGSEVAYSSMSLTSGTAGSTVAYKTPETLRSGAAVNKAMLLSTDYTPADFLLGITKSLGLLLRFDSTANTVTVMSRNDFFRDGVTDIDSRVDRGREMTVTPLTFDTKWLGMEATPVGGAFSDYYTDTYGSVYGSQRIGTGYDFNSDTRQLMEGVVFRSAVQAVENSRYFNDVTAGGVDVLSQQLDAGNSLAYRNASGDTKPYDVPVASSPSISYWGSASFPDSEGYDWLLAGKPQCHAADGKPVDGSGVLLIRTGSQVYDRFKISDDTQEMMTLNDGTPCWRMDEGPGVTVPLFSRHKTSPIYKLVAPMQFEYLGEGVTVSLDFGRVREFASPYTAYFPGDDTVTVYEKMWRPYLRDRYDVDTRVVTCWVNLSGIQVGADLLRRFWWFDNAVWSLNRIINASVTTDDPVQCEFVKVGDLSAYLYGQDFGGSQLRGFLSLTVSPATASVTVDGRSVTLEGGEAELALTAGQHIVEASGDGLETVSQSVTIVPEETVTLSITLQPRQGHLTIVTLPAGLNPTVSVRVNGSTVTYTEGMNVAPGATVAVTVSKSGYTTVTDSFTMPGDDVVKTYTLTQNIEATISYPDEITYAAQAVRMTVSDPSNHGWSLDWSSELYLGYITGGAVVSGNAQVSGASIVGTGDAVVTLSVSENTGSYGRTVGSRDLDPIFFRDTTTSGYSNITFYQNDSGTSLIPVTSVTLNKSTLSLGSGASERLTATVRPTNATNKTLTWTTSDSSVATVSQDGTVHAVGSGTAVIRATATDGSGKYATCTVTVSTPWSLTADDITVTSAAEAASSVLHATGIQTATLSASCGAEWVTAASVDTSGNPFYVRLTLTPNTAQVSRSAQVTVTALNTAGQTVTATFTVTQNGSTPSDIPCTGMEIDGTQALAVSSNRATYTVSYAPDGCTQNACEWSVAGYAGTDLTDRVSLTANGNSCVLRLLDETMANETIYLTARNTYNASVSDTLEITATYVQPVTGVVVNPTAVNVLADAVYDNTPTVTLGSGISVSDLTITHSGFIDSANISNGHLVTLFSQNTSESQNRAGYVYIRYTDPVSGSEELVQVGYTQMRKKNTAVGLSPAALYIRQSGATVLADFQIMFRNGGTSDYQFKGLGYTVVGLDANDNEVFTHSLGLPIKTVAPGSEIGQYSDSWTGSLGASTHYIMTVRNGATLSESQTMDGDDSWIIN